MTLAVQIHNLSKRYRLGVYGAKTLREDFQRMWWRARGKGDPLAKIGEENRLDADIGQEFIWALRDINLEVEQGEVLGIIGKNGAGKSTLLKVLSRITSPTEGEVRIRGRLGSLLEVGTGFHPELTGRENIYLNGAIHGMTRREIDRKFDDIVDFAGVAKYIDTPVKRYSSGMYVRLGFAVAAFLEPDILVVDEVLAVGDAEFQKRAIGKMQEVSRGEGRTVLFVSHNMGSIRQLCSRAILLDRGKIKAEGNVDKVISTYLEEKRSIAEFVSKNTKQDIYIKKAQLGYPNVKDRFLFSESITLYVEIIVRNYQPGLQFSFAMLNRYSNRVFTYVYPFNEKQKYYKLLFKLPNKLFAPGHYSFDLAIDIPNQVLFSYLDRVLNFEIIDEGSLLSSYNAFTGDIIIEPQIITI